LRAEHTFFDTPCNYCTVNASTQVKQQLNDDKNSRLLVKHIAHNAKNAHCDARAERNVFSEPAAEL